MRTFEEYLEKSRMMHGGHACAGIVIGVRLTMLACKSLGVDDPEADPNGSSSSSRSIVARRTPSPP